jgi:2,4-dienoyl-CoA reductase-like NADH-dependent reductase (Old Yellow Enzyme family)/NADPH-dependent 2,4-dienoyl-CoA reductase/sulfur reductase-like enzyme
VTVPIGIVCGTLQKTREWLYDGNTAAPSAGRKMNLLSPGKIGSLQLKNRIVLAAMGSNFAEEDGSCGERIQAYYEERARGGTGLLVLETSAIAWPAGATMPRTVGFSEDRFVEGLSQLTTRVHNHGAKIAAQLNHGGKVAQEDVAAGRPILVPSIPSKGRSDMFALLTPTELGNFVKAAGPDGRGPRYHVMEQADIETLVAQFAAAADRAKQANFDAVEIHAGHGYVISSFLSPSVNKRTDNYGGSRENRARLLCEIILATRQTVGPDFPIIVRFDAHEFRIESGITIEDALVTAQLAEKAGADALDVSAYGNTAIGVAFTEAPLVHQPGGFLNFAKAIKKQINIPVIAVGRIEVDAAEKGLSAGDFDFVAMGRKLLADPHLPNKLAANKADDIRPCIYCYVCVSKIFINDAMSCAVNPDCGQEYKTNVIASSNEHKKVLVIGAGPGGLEAARTLAERGHTVTLWEREKDLGGTARVAALPYEPNQRLVKFLSRTVRELPITIETGKDATLDEIRAFAPDSVIVATGANRAAPPITGKDQRHVFDGNELRGLLFGTDAQAAKKLTVFQRLIVTMGQISQLLRSISALRLLSKIWMPLSKRVVLIGGGLVGLELAEYLHERGRDITVIEPSPNLGAELSIVRRARIIHELRENGVAMHSGANTLEITKDSVEFEVDGERQSVKAQHVIIAMGAEPDTTLSDQIQSAGIHTISVGDCHEVGYIEGAVHSGRAAALSI